MPDPIFPPYKVLLFNHTCTEFFAADGLRWCRECRYIHARDYEKALDLRRKRETPGT